MTSIDVFLPVPMHRRDTAGRADAARARFAAGIAVGAMLIAACGGEDSAPEAGSEVDVAVSAPGAAKPSAAALATSPGKPGAPIRIDYTVMGTPVVGQPVNVNIELTTDLTDRPITMRYRVTETGSMTFPESQPSMMELLPVAGRRSRSQQVRVVPQREGRVFLVVSAEVQTADGALLKTISIPLRVGRAPEAPDMNGEVVEGVDGERGISMPAAEPR